MTGTRLRYNDRCSIYNSRCRCASFLATEPCRVATAQSVFEKIESYVGIISGPAIEAYGATPYTYRAVDSAVANSIFKFHDTLTSRAEITDLTERFKDDLIAVIGLGGTGAYVLDFLVKTPVREIRAFDHDPFHVHNAFRSPGRIESAEFGRTKAEVYFKRYENFRNGLSVHSKFVDASSTDFQGVTFAFVCVDKGTSRSGIFELLIANHIPFIDVGMGLKRTDDGLLNGQTRCRAPLLTASAGVDSDGIARDGTSAHTGGRR